MDTERGLLGKKRTLILVSSPVMQKKSSLRKSSKHTLNTNVFSTTSLRLKKMQTDVQPP
jgi:hypothetical protein